MYPALDTVTDSDAQPRTCTCTAAARQVDVWCRPLQVGTSVFKNLKSLLRHFSVLDQVVGRTRVRRPVDSSCYLYHPTNGRVPEVQPHHKPDDVVMTKLLKGSYSLSPTSQSLTQPYRTTLTVFGQLQGPRHSPNTENIITKWLSSIIVLQATMKIPKTEKMKGESQQQPPRQSLQATPIA